MSIVFNSRLNYHELLLNLYLLILLISIYMIVKFSTPNKHYVLFLNTAIQTSFIQFYKKFLENILVCKTADIINKETPNLKDTS